MLREGGNNRIDWGRQLEEESKAGTASSLGGVLGRRGFYGTLDFSYHSVDRLLIH